MDVCLSVCLCLAGWLPACLSISLSHPLPPCTLIPAFPPTKARNYVASLPHYPKKDFFKFFVGANPNAIDLLSHLLEMDPDKRPTPEEALGHPYLAKYHDPEDEVSDSPPSLSLSHHPCMVNSVCELLWVCLAT